MRVMIILILLAMINPILGQKSQNESSAVMISGKVVDARTGIPIEGAAISGPENITGKTDSEGIYAMNLSSIISHVISIKASKDKYRSQKSDINYVGKNAQLNFWLVGLTPTENITVGSNGADYVTIQKAIQVAKSGSIIEVQKGVYHEAVKISKNITLFGSNVDGEMPVIDAYGNESAISIFADGVIIGGLTLTNSSIGIDVKSNKSVIYDNIIGFNIEGMRITGSNNLVIQNEITDNINNGILLLHSAENVIINNFITCNGNDGLALGSAYYINRGHTIGNLIAGNVFRENKLYDINTWTFSANNTIIGNAASDIASTVEKEKPFTRGAEPEYIPKIDIRSSPPGADVYIDNVNIGSAEVKKELNSGTHNLRLSLTGYQDINEEVIIGDDDKNVEFTLNRSQNNKQR
jgi:hypothetical protein